MDSRWGNQTEIQVDVTIEDQTVESAVKEKLQKQQVIKKAA
nr:hypothetical protein [Cellvibrio fontiphilus]